MSVEQNHRVEYAQETTDQMSAINEIKTGVVIEPKYQVRHHAWSF